MYSDALQMQFDMLRFWQQEGSSLANHLINSKRRLGDLSRWTPQLLNVTVQAMLFEATPFYVSQNICSLLEHMQEGYPDSVIHPEDFIEQTGFVVFERPVMLPIQERWHKQGLGLDIDEDGRKFWRSFARGMRAFLWSYTTAKDEQGKSAPIMFSITFSDRVWANGEFANVPWPGTLNNSPIGLPWETDEVLDRYAALPDLAEREKELGVHAEDVLIMGQERTRFISLLMHFFQQPFAALTRQRADRATRKRIERSDIPRLAQNEVRVITLRKSLVTYRDRQVTDIERDQREYDFQWMVAGHWRKQHFPSLGPAYIDGVWNERSHKPIYIHPYLKGPDDKPIKPPSPKIFAVTR